MYVNSEVRPLTNFPYYGLVLGDKIEILKGNDCAHKRSDHVEVVQEFPLFILVKYVYKSNDGHIKSYRRCLNKALIVSGDISFHKIIGGYENDINGEKNNQRDL